MKPGKNTFVLLLLMVSILQGCDTKLNVKSPTENYFVKYFGSEGSQTGTDMVVNADGSFILFGTSHILTGDPQFYLVKSDALGAVQWERTFGANCQARDVELVSDGTIAVLGNMIHPGRSDYDVILTIWDQDGNLLDSVGIEHTDFNNSSQQLNEDASTVTETDDGFLIAGSTGNIVHADPSYIRDPLIERLFRDPSNNLVPYPSPWSVYTSFAQGTESFSTKIVQLPDRTIYVFGYTNYNLGPRGDFEFWYFSLNQNGSNVFGPTYIGTLNTDQRLLSVSADTSPLGAGFFLGGIQLDGGGYKLFISKLHHPALEFGPGDYTQIPGTFLGFDLGKLDEIGTPPDPLNQHVSVYASASSGFLILTNENTTGNNNILLTKVDPYGVPWSTPAIFGGQGDDFAGSVKELPDGKIMIIGTMTVGAASVNNGETKMVLIKVNQDGQFSD